MPSDLFQKEHSDSPKGDALCKAGSRAGDRVAGGRPIRRLMLLARQEMMSLN